MRQRPIGLIVIRGEQSVPGKGANLAKRHMDAFGKAAVVAQLGGESVGTGHIEFSARKGQLEERPIFGCKLHQALDRCGAVHSVGIADDRAKGRLRHCVRTFHQLSSIDGQHTLQV